MSMLSLLSVTDYRCQWRGFSKFIIIIINNNDCGAWMLHLMNLYEHYFENLINYLHIK